MKKIIAVGNAGGNIADSIREQGIGIEDTEFVYLDTDKESLYNHGEKTDHHIHLSNAEAVKDFTDEIIEGLDMVIVTAGLGGATGSQCSASIGCAAAKAGIKTTAFVSLPFFFEGEKKNVKAIECLERLKDVFDEVFVQENDHLYGGFCMGEFDTTLCDKYAKRYG